MTIGIIRKTPLTEAIVSMAEEDDRTVSNFLGILAKREYNTRQRAKKDIEDGKK